MMPLVLVDSSGQVRYFNSHAARLLGVSESEAPFSFSRHIASERDAGRFLRSLQDFFGLTTATKEVGLPPLSIELSSIGSGDRRNVLVEFGYPPQDLKLAMDCALILIRDVTVYVRLEKQLRSKTLEDYLTGLHNRRYLDSVGKQEFDRARRDQISRALLLIDIDHFKKVNDTHGHLIGDHVLQDTARVLQESVRQGDILSRVGGEEFVIILFGVDAKEACSFTEDLLRKIRETTIRTVVGDISVTLSVGVAMSDPLLEDFAAWYNQADNCLYDAKRSGRDRYSMAS